MSLKGEMIGTKTSERLRMPIPGLRTIERSCRRFIVVAKETISHEVDFPRHALGQEACIEDNDMSQRISNYQK